MINSSLLLGWLIPVPSCFYLMVLEEKPKILPKIFFTEIFISHSRYCIVELILTKCPSSMYY